MLKPWHSEIPDAVVADVAIGFLGDLSCYTIIIDLSSLIFFARFLLLNILSSLNSLSSKFDALVSHINSTAGISFIFASPPH